MTQPRLIPDIRDWLGQTLQQLCGHQTCLHWRNMPAPTPPSGSSYLSVGLQADGEDGGHLLGNLLGPRRLLSGQIYLTVGVSQGQGTARLDLLLEILRRDLAGQDAGWIRLGPLVCGAAYSRSIYHCQDASLTFTASEEIKT